MRRLVGLVLLVLCAACASAGSAMADPYPVTNTDDSGAGSLRAAILAANSHTGADTIPIAATGTIELLGKLPQIEGDLAITGPGPASLTVKRDSAAGFFRIFEFNDGVTGSLTGMTVTGGSSGAGGGILNGSGSLTLTRVAVVGNEAVVEEVVSAATADGGGIRSAGPLTLRESVVSGNQATAREGLDVTAAGGAGIFAFGKLTIDRSTISGNVAKAVSDGGEIYVLGGGIDAIGEVKIERSTISGNSILADGAAATQASGGGIAGSKGELTSVTVTDNSASATEAFGANLFLPDEPIVSNTLVSESRGDADSCSGTYLSGGFNLDEDGSCEFDEGSDLNGVPAGLDPVLKDNGGPTPTHALLPGSVAIDRGSSFGSSVDQRGLPRPSDFPTIGNKEGGDGSDIGAFELQVPAGGTTTPPILVSAEARDKTPPRTRIVSGPARVGFERLAKFRFASNEPQSTFRCKVDHKRWRKCRSPYKVRVEPGKHFFRVRAIDRFGNADRTAARFSWRVKPVG
ncbi:MAG TPA: choice-of-anchor Q domain-containing protein [Solirubrobacterales bacterium]|nr:choice-of-anchor Q domain-containing protein [Solirubrobacterales bacterium]